MRIFIDGEEMDFSFETDSKDEIYSRVKDEVTRRGCVISTITVDGAALEEEAFLALSGGMEARFEAMPVRELVMESLSDGTDYMKRLSSGLEKVADMLEEDKTAEGLQLLQHAAEGIGWSMQVMHNCQILLGLSDNEIGDGKVGELKTNLVAELEKASSSVESGKHLELSYNIRTGVLPEIQKLAGYMQELLDAGRKPIQ
ncbi:MAG: hypothetical protein GX181_08420 [Synergistaceae bacterium]|nr:hypothetical protein [Synergistota bacterium]NLM71966.1 hypothetical protein [Synergistaceae bacterium]